MLDLYDPGAASPKETWLRLLVIRADYPPQTQIPVTSADGRRQYYLDMGWEEMMLALEYDGEQHRLDPIQYRYDIQRSEDLSELDGHASGLSRRTPLPISCAGSNAPGARNCAQIAKSREIAICQQTRGCKVSRD